MNIQYQISYIRENEKEIEVKVRLLEGDYKDVLVESDLRGSVMTKQFADSKIIDTVVHKFPAKTTREEINKYFNTLINSDKTRVSIWSETK